VSGESRLTLLGIEEKSINTETLSQLQGAISAINREFVESLRTTVMPTTSNGAHVLIVGGGIMGILAAVFLRLEGHRVTVLERMMLGAAASTRDGGGMPALGRDVREMPLILASQTIWSILPEIGIHTQIEHTGHAMIAMNDSEAETLQAAQGLYAAAGLHTEWFSSDEAVALLPDLTHANAGALYSPVDAQDYPFTSINSALEWLKEHGVQMVNHCEVTGFEVTSERVSRVRTTKGLFAADVVVLSAGPWTTPIAQKLGLNLPVLPRRSQIAVTEPFEHRRMNPFVSGNGLYARQTQYGNVVFGGGGAWEKTGFDVDNTTEVVKMLSSRLIELFPTYRTTQLIRAWAGTVEITPDHFPLLGLVRGYDNVIVSAGYSGHGYGMAAITSRIVARIVSAMDSKQEFAPEVSSLLVDFDPMRFQNDLTSIHS